MDTPGYGLEYFEWSDSVNRPGWVDVDGVIDYLDAPRCVSVGFVVEETEEFVYLSTTISDAACLAPVAIPVAALTARRVLRAFDEEAPCPT